MDVNSRDPSQNIIPFRIKGVEVARFDICGNLGIGTNTPSANLEVAGTVKINGELYVNGRALNSLTSGVVVNMDSQPAPATALNRQKKQSIPLATASTLSTSDIIAKMSGVSVGKTQTYGVGAAQMASYGNIVVAVGSGTNSIAYSLVNPPTASSWVGIPNSANTFTTRGQKIAYANGTWVALGRGTNTIAYSTMTPPVASSWVGIPTGSTFNGVKNTFIADALNIAYGNGAWVVVGDSDSSNCIAYSLANPPTVESWIGIPTSSTIFGISGYGITFGNGTWVAGGYGTNTIAYSTRTPPTSDSWVGVPLTNQNDAGISNVFSLYGINVIYANGVWLATGNNINTLCYSIENPPIAGSWMPITSAVLFGSQGLSVAYGNGTWVAFGSGTIAYSTSRIPHSSSWVSMKGPTPSQTGSDINISFNASTNTWYFLGYIGNNCMFYSTATPPVPATWIGVQKSAGAFMTQAYGAIGITTNAFTSPINVARLDNKVTFPVNRMLAVGGGGGGNSDILARSSASPAPAITGTISYSDDDGATWAMVPGGATNAMFSSAADIAAGASFGVGGSRGANAVAWNGEKWVAAGNGRTNSLAFSDDGGMTWTGITGKSVFSVEARDVAWNGQMWVAVGRGINFSTAYSYDGVTWIGPVDASGAPVNVFSYDIAGPTAAMSDISGGGNHVIWTGKIWVATGTRTLIAGSSPAAYYTVAYSVDGKTWTGVADSGATSTGFDMYAYGIAWNGRNFVVTGRGTTNTLALSTDVTASSSSSSWQGLGNTVFSVWGRGITWGARRWMATGRGTNTVAFSTNGRNWQGCGANVFKPMRRFMAMGDTGLYTGVVSGQPQRGVAFTYSDDGVTWDAPVVNQAVAFSIPFGTSDDTVRSVVYTNQMFLTNAITDDAATHQSLMYSIDAGASWSRVPGSSDTEANGGTGMTAGSNRGCYSIATNSTRTRFIAGGGDSASATSKVYFSNDGFNWNRSVSSPNSNTQFAWVYASLWVGGGYNRWLIGGNNVATQTNGQIMYSGDADAVAAWTTASGTFTGTIISCFAANTDFTVILAGATSGNKIYRSAINGGVTWTTTDISNTPIGSVRSIAFSPSLGRWVAVGGGGGAANTIIYSTDATATAWIAPPIQAKTMPTAIFKNGSEVTRVIWDALNGGRFIIGGYNGVSDYASFTNVAGADGANNNPGYTMAYSTDGVNWTPVTIRASDASTSSSGTSSGPFMTRCREIMALDVSGEYTPINTGYSVTWNSYANRFVATGNGTTPVVYSSDGGVTWTPANQQPPQQATAVAGGAFAAANTTSVSPITYTIDGKTWSQGIGAKEIFGASGYVLCVKYGQTSTAISPNGRIWVAGATGGSTSCLAFSQNGIRWTAIASANTMIGAVRAIAYAPAEQLKTNTGAISNAAVTAASGVGNGVWVAGGHTTNSLIFSYDGISWSEVPGSLGILTRCNACAFGNGIFVAGGTAGTTDPTAVLAYSTDGINWQPIRGTASRISSGASIRSITYGRDERGRGLWVAGVATASGVPNISLLYSYNGIDWIGVNNSSSLSSFISGIAYGVSATTGQGLWVASVYNSGSSYSFLFSTTGRDGWTTVTNTRTGLFDLTGTYGATGISYSNGVWYATGVSTGRTLAYSYEGNGGWFGVYPSSNMYGAVIPTFSATDMYCIATTNDYMIPSSAVGSPTAMVPVRSIGWTAGVGSAYLQHPTLLFGTASTTTASTASTASTATAISTDGGRSWGSSTVSLGTSAFRGGVCNDAFWNGAIWVAVGYDAVSGAKVATSRDGVTWSQIPAGAVPISGILYSVMWNGTVWMVGGDGSPTNDANTASIAWSSDLSTWNAVANTDTKLYLVKRISWNGMYWVAVGLGTVSSIMYSKDRKGLVWEDTYISSSSIIPASTIASAVNDVVWGGGRWVAVGRGNDIVGGGGVSILYSADTPVVGSEVAEYAITGRRWTGVASSASMFPYGASSVCWNGKRFVATGPAYSSKSAPAGNIIAWSADGISWTAYSTTKTVAPGQRWVAVGSGSAATIATSADGRTWTDVSGSSLLFADISGANVALVNTMGTGARAIGWNGSSLIVGGARSATTATPASLLTATATTGRTTIPVCAFIGSGNGVMGGGTTNVPMDTTAQTYIRNSSSVFITHLDVNMREASAPWANMWLNTYTDLSATQLFQVTPESQSFSSALKWNGWSWVANFGMTTFSPVTGDKYGSIWYCTDPLARVGWSVASNYATPRILMGQGGYSGLEWNGAAWLACGYDPNNNNLIYTTDKYGAVGWTAVSGIVSSGSASFQPVCIASSSRFWVVGGSLGTTSALYYTNDRTGATGWKAISTAGSVLPGIRITSVGYNGAAWICCGGGGGGTGSPASSISWRVDGDDIGTGWATATVSGTSGGIPSNMSTCSAISYNAGAASPIWVVVGDVSGSITNQVAYTTSLTGSIEWKTPASDNTFTLPTFSKLNGIAWTGYSWIASCGAGASRIVSSTDITAASSWNNATNGLYSPTLNTNAVAYANIPISLLTTGMVSSAGVGAGSGAMWRAGVGRAQGLLPGGGGETTSVVVRSSNGAEGITWSQTYSRNFLIAVGGGVIRDAMGGSGTNRMAYSYDGGLSWTTNNTAVLTTASGSSVGSIRTVKYSNGIWVAGGDCSGSSVSGNNCLAWSRDGVNWTGAGGTQIFGSAGSCYAVCCNDRGRWVAVGGAALTTAGTYTNVSGSIYTMAWSDDGMNWTPIVGSRALFGIVCQGVSYGADASGVGMWTAIGRGGAYTGCAYSYDGKSWFLSQTSGSLFGTSVNVLTERYAPVASANWKCVSVSATGQYQSAGRNEGYFWISSDYGVTWTSPGGAPACYSISVSSTGQYQTAVMEGGYIWTSSNYGVTWTSRATSSSWRPVSISATGQYQTAAANGGNIWTSSDYGVTWTSRATILNWQVISVSSTGQYQSAGVYNGKIWTSSDYGLTWVVQTQTPDIGNMGWYSMSLSSTGQYQSAVVGGGLIWTSSNYGVTWASRNSSIEYRSVSVSSTGQYQSVAVETGNIWTSSNYGVNWTERTGNLGCRGISLSSTGQYQTAVAYAGTIYISSNFGETWSSGATDSRSLGITYGKDASGAGMWVATAGRRDRDVAASAANTMAYSYDGKLWRGIAASAGLSEQAWTVAYGKDGFGVGMWVAGGYDRSCGLKWSYDGVTWNATTGASGASVWTGMAAGRRVLSVYWNGSMWLASTSDTRNGEPRGTGIAANNASSTPGYLLYSYNGKNWLPVLAPNTYNATIPASPPTSVYSVLPNPAILDFGSFYDDQAQRGTMIANTTARTVGAVFSNVPIENVNTIIPYGRGSLTTGQVPFLMGGDSGLVDTAAGAPPITSDIATSTTSLSTSTDGGITWRAVPNSTKVMTKVNKILCDESTQQIVAVGAGNYSVATSTPARAADADGWVGVFGSRMTNTRTGLFEKYGTAATWFSGAKMWIASGRTQSRRGSSLAVSVNGTVWQDAKIVSQMAAGASLGGRGGGLTSRTTTSLATQVGGMNSVDSFQLQDMSNQPLYSFTSHRFTNANKTGNTGPNISECRTAYSGVSWVNTYLNMTTNGIQLWTVPITGTYTIRAAGAAGGNSGTYGRGRDIQTSTVLTKGEVIKILVGQKGSTKSSQGGGGGGTFVVRDVSNAIIVAGGGGGRGETQSYINSNASGSTSGNRGGDGGTGDNGNGGTNGLGGRRADIYACGGGGGGLIGAGVPPPGGSVFSFIAGGTSFNDTNVGAAGGFGCGAGGGWLQAYTEGYGAGGGGGGGYSGGGGGLYPLFASGGGGGSFAISTITDYNAINTTHGYVYIELVQFTAPIVYYTSTLSTAGGVVPYTSIAMNSSVIPYTAPATPLLTYTDSAAAFSTQVSSVATNSQYNRAVVGGSSVQFVAGGRGIGSNGSGLVYSNDGQNWTAVESGAATVFQTPTNVAAYSTAPLSGGFDSSFGTVALTQRLTVPATYPSGTWYGVSVSSTGQYQSAVVQNGNIWTSSDYGVTWTERTQYTGQWQSISLSSTGQYQSACSNSTNGYIHTSSDYGVTWTPRTQFADYWSSISVSSTGQYQSACMGILANGVYIYISSDYGVTWREKTQFNGNWFSISLSSTGQYQSAVNNNAGSGAYIYTSSDYGVSWSQRTTNGAISNTWGCISVSSTGQYQTAGAISGKYLYTSSDYGVTWVQKSTVGSWVSVSISSTGQYQSAISESVNIYTSSDFGNTWTVREIIRNWYRISVSSTGQYQTAVAYSGTNQNNIYTSTNYGVTWVQRSTATRTNAFTRIKSSASGQYQLATSGPVGNTNGQLYVSSDYGQTWIPRRGLSTWLGGAVSATGAVMTAFSTPTTATAALLRSTDYGNTFSEIPNTALTGSAYWRAIATTNSAATQTALAYGSTIYRSFDTGATWSNTSVVDVVGILSSELSSVASLTYAWKSIAMSSDAKYQTGVLGGTSITGQIYVNSNYGREAWTAVDSARNWASVSMSADGRYQSAVVTSGAIYYNSTFGTGTWTAVSTPTGQTWTSIAVSSASGQYQTAVASGATNIYVNSNYGVNGSWTSKDNQRNWFGVAVSSTGQYQTAINRSGYIYVDISFGAAASWTSVLTDTPRDWVSVAMSSTGQYQTAVVASGKIYVNNNYGANGAWTETESNRAWISVAVSGATGRYQTAVAQNAQIYTNATFGMGAWIPVDSSRNWISVTVSADGKNQSAAVATSGQIYFSRDYGATWSTTAGVDIMGNKWQDVAVAAETGAVQVTCVSGGYIYYSGDTGATWTSSIVSIDGVSPQTTNRAWQAVAISANGQYGLACVNSTTASGFLYRSLNYGASWTSSSVVIDGVSPQTTNRAWQDVGLSANGKYQVACLNNGTQTAFTSNIASTVSVMVPPPGALATTYGSWGKLGLDISGTQASEQSGNSVSLSADGTTVAIGSRYYDVIGSNAEGRTRIYKYNNGTSSWGQLGLDISGNQTHENSGYSVSLSADGTTVAIGSYGYDKAGGTTNANTDEGRTRIYKYNGTSWGQLGLDISGTQVSENSGFSVSLSADGTTVAIGSSGYDITNDNEGRTRIYKYNGTSWGQLGLDISGTQTSEYSGYSVSLSADGTTVAIGSYGYDKAGGTTNAYTDEGRTRIYKYNNGTSSWGQLGLDISGNQANEQSGNSVSLSADGTIVAIGSQYYDVTGTNNTNEGRTRIYKYNNGTSSWGQLGLDISGTQVDEYSGFSVSLSADGTIVAIGSNAYDKAGGTTNANTDEGRTRIYKYNNVTSSWGQLGLDISGTQASELSGHSVSLSADGTTVAIGSWGYNVTGTDEGRTRIYKIDTFGNITYTSSNPAVADIYGNLLLIKGAVGSLNFTATQGATTTNGTLTVNGATYTLVYTIVSATSFIYYSKDYGASWSSLTAAGSRSWSSIALSENGGTISATTNDATGAIWTYTMPDDQYYRPPAITNVTGIGSVTTATVRAITYGNSGTGAATDGYWVAGADASANTLAYSSNGMDWTAVVGSKTTLFNSVNGVAYGADLSGAMMWVAVGAPFVGSVPGSTAYSIAYSYNMTNWTGVRNLANFTGQGNHVAYGQDEYGTGMWVAVGQGSGALAFNLGSSSFGNSNGVVNTTVFYSYDGTNWSAGQGAGVFSTSGTDVAWGVDASGVATWVATGVGYTDLLTGVVIPGGQVAHSTNGRLWTPIRALTAIVPAPTPTTLTSRINVLPPPPASTGFVTSIFGTTWGQLGSDILGTQASELSGYSVSISADGTTVAIGSYQYNVTGTNAEGRTRIYKYNNGTSSWGQLGLDISGTQASEYSGSNVSLSADGTTVAIGSYVYNVTGIDEGRTRIYKYNNGTSSWGQLGLDISGTQASEYSGYSVSLSADGTVVAIGSSGYDVTGTNNEGRTRIYKYNGTTWGQLGLDISGNQAQEQSGYSVSLSADGTTVAIGSNVYNNANTDDGRTRIYKYNNGTSSWGQLGLDISGNQVSEQSGTSVSLSADGTTVAIGSYQYNVTGIDEGRTRIYKYNNGTSSWGQLGLDISGNQAYEYSGYSVSLSADGTTLAIGSQYYDKAGGTTNANTDEGGTRVYKYNGTAWGQLGLDISGTQASERSGFSVSLSADGTTVAIGSINYDKAGGTANSNTSEGRTRIYKLDATGAFFSSSNPAVADICGNGLLIIKDISTGTTTITATQPASPPFSLTPAIVQGTLTVTGTTYTLIYNNVVTTFTPFTTSALSVAYGRGGSQGAGAPLWMVGGSGGNVFAMSSAPTTTGAWSVVATTAPTAAVPFPICNSIGYSNGIWVAGNNTDTTNVLARSIDGGSTWTPVPLSSVSGILAGSASVGANAFCNYSLAYADYSNDTNLRSWISVQGTKNFMFEGGVNAVATVSSNIVASTYNSGESTTVIPSTASVMVAPPGALTTTYGTLWGQLGLDISGTQVSENSGYSVSLSADGTTVAIGSLYYDVTGTNNEGRTRIYKYNNGTSSWVQLGLDISGTQVGEQSGYSVSLSADGTTVAIGSYQYNVTGIDEGRTRIYKYNNGTSSWGQLGLDISGNQAYEYSGYSVSLSADGTTVAIGSYAYNVTDYDVGRTRIYKYNNGTSSWGQLGLDISGTQANEQSGYSVSLSADGTMVAIGSAYYDATGTNNTNDGRTRIYKYNIGTSSWGQLGLDISGTQVGEQSGYSVSLSADGTTVAIGSRYYDVTDYDVGRTRIYKYNNGTSSWGQLGLDISGNQASEYSGWSVSLSADGTTVAIGSYAYNNANTDEGRTRIYKYNGTSSWVQLGLDISGNQASELSGCSVSLSADGTTVAIGSYQYDVTGFNEGRTRIYKIDTFGNITYTSSNSSVADIYGNLLLIKGVDGSSNIVATQGSTITNSTLTVSGTTYTLVPTSSSAWWVAGGSGTSSTGVSGAVIAYTTDPSGAAGWTKSVSAGVASLSTVNDIAFSPQTQQWLAVGVGASGSSTQNILFSDASGATWTASAVATPVTPVITLNTCIWNQLDASASAAGRWIAGGTRNDISVSIPTSATLYISTDTSGAASPWTPIAGTGAILSQVYSAAFNGRVWIAAGVPAIDSGSTSTLMRTTDPTGAAGWQGIATTNASISGFDTAARSITWNADQQMWVATGENTATAGSGAAVDASFSSVIYSLDVSGSAGTWRTVRESNSTCFSGQGNGIAFSGRKWFAVGEGTNQIVATTDVSANTAFGTGAAATWSSIGNANTALPVRGTDIAFTGRNLVATGVGSGSSSGVVISTDPTGSSWSTAAAAGFTDSAGGGTSITFEPTYDGTGRLVATGKSATNSITVSSDGGATWNTSATTPATGVQLSSQRAAPVTTTQSLFTMGGNSVAYVGNDTLLGGGGNDVHWTGKRWIATGKNSGVDTATTAATTTVTASPATAPDITNNNTASVAVSDDGITWQCVSSGQAPNIAEGIFVATNSRIGATPLIDSRITIMDGGDTESTIGDYSSSSGNGGMGAGIAQVDIIAELPVTSVSASNTTGTVTTIGVGSNNVMNTVNGVGVTPVASFDNTAFTITTRPV